MALRFTVHAVEATLAGGYFEQVVDGTEAVVGRGQDVDLLLPDPAVSLQHLVVRERDGRREVEDLGSHLGTRLNGRRLTPGQAVPLRPHDRLEAGPFQLQVEAGTRPGQQTGSVARQVIRRLRHQDAAVAQDPSGGTGPAGLPRLRVVNGPAAGRDHTLPPGRGIRVGRGVECEMVIDDARVSRVHARVIHRAGDVWIEDCGSSNGTRVDGNQIRGARKIAPGSRIRLGRVELSLEGVPARSSPADRSRWLITAAIGFGIGGLLVALGL